MNAPVKTISDVWGTAPPAESAVLDRSSRDLPLSSFDPLSGFRSPQSEVLDYDTMMLEIDRLEARIQELKMQASRSA